MKDLPADILRAAYVAATEAKLPGSKDAFALVIAQTVNVERHRASRILADAIDALRKAGDGSAEHVRDTAIDIMVASLNAVTAGDAA